MTQPAKIDITTLVEALRATVTTPTRVEENKAMLERYGRVFSPSHLPHLTADEFKSFLLYKNNKHWWAIHRHGNLITKDMPKLREALGILLDEAQPIRHRLDTLFPKNGPSMIKWLGPAVSTPILLVSQPERYGVLNRRTVSALKLTSLWPEGAGSGFAQRYSAVNSVLTDLARRYNLALLELDEVLGKAEDVTVGTEAMPAGGADEIPKVGTSACRDFFLSWGEINAFFHLILDMVGYIEGTVAIMRQSLIDTTTDEQDRDRLRSEEDAWEGPAARLRKRQQFLFEIILVRHVENYLNYLSGLLFDIFTQRPETLKSSEKIALDQVLSHDNMDDLIRTIAQTKVDSLSHQSFYDLVAYFGEHFGLALFPQGQVALLAEAVQTRNISVHTRCIINERYVKRTGAPELLIGTKRDLSMEDLAGLVPLLADGVRKLDGQARKKLKLRGTRFDVDKLLDASVSSASI